MLHTKSVCHACHDAVPVISKPDSILVHGAKEHNLKNICFEIPKGKLVALTGPSGSGKSSIATDILQAECIRQYLESLGMTTDHIAKAKVDIIMGLSPSIGVSQRRTDFNPRSTVGTRTGILTILRNMFATLGYQVCAECNTRVKQPLQDKQKLITVETIEEKADATVKKTKKSYFNCPHCHHDLEKLQMNHFSFNTTAGACEQCKGLGEVIAIDSTRLIHENKTLFDGGVDWWNEATAKHYANVILAASRHYGFLFDATQPIKNYTPEQKDFLLYGITSADFIKKYKDIKTPKKVSDGNFEGLIPSLMNIYKKDPIAASDHIKKYIVHEPCTECNGSRLGKLAREVTVGEKTISEISILNLTELLQWLHALSTKLSEHELLVFKAFAHALQTRISHIIEVGLDYLTLDRTLPSLSAGESQRLRLANLLGSGLTGVLYVLDEPTTGLHPHDTTKLLNMLRMIQQSGNTVLVIEHDPEFIKHVDYVLDIGPGGGSNGGTVVITGTPSDVKNCTSSLTGKYLNYKPQLSHTTSSSSNNVLTIYGAQEYNLKNIDISVPTKQFVVLTGASGSGKSTLLFDIIDKVARNYFNGAHEKPGKHTAIEGLEHFNRVVTVDQVTIGNSKSTRSNIATYTKLFDLIRDLFASLPVAKSRKYGPEKFSFNTSDERCENCNGAGTVEVDMTFMPNIETECPVCNGMRFTDELLTIHYKEYNIAQVLNMTVSDALQLFKDERKICTLLKTLQEVGLEYLTLGQSTSTLSGGEAQRIKLATELCKPDTGNTLYLLDEPTTGLHPSAVQDLIYILQRLVSKGNTVVVIEHNLEVIARADTIIDFGPGGGSLGGTIVATGTPHEIAANKSSLIGQALKTYIS